MTRALTCLCLVLAVASGLGAAGLTYDFGTATVPPYLNVTGEARLADGLLQTQSQAGWLRSGVEVGPLPVSTGSWTVAYDFRPVSLGGQAAEFVSASPSTHWYMCFVGSDGRLNLYTRGPDGWKGRTRSETACQAGQWYQATITLSRRSIRFVCREKGAAAVLWDSGVVAMEDTGEQTTCALVDEAADDNCRTDWDNLALQASEPRLQAELAAVAAAAEAARQRRAEMARTTEALRRAGLALLPTPQQVTLLPGVLKVSRISLSGGTAADAAAVVRVLQERCPGLAVRPASGSPGGGRTSSGTCALLLRPRRGAGLPWRNDQGYRLTVGARELLLEAQSPAGFFYGAQTLSQLLEGGAARQCRLTDWPDLPARLAMVAVSQGGFQVIDVDYWKRLIRELAAARINYLMPYDEGGSFSYEKYPFLGLKGKDGFTVGKGRLLSAYAREHFVGLVPQQEMLGHSGSVLAHEELQELRESGSVFCSSNPKTFAFLGDLMDELVRMFPDSDYIHVGGDEFGHGFAKCKACQARAAQLGRPGLYAEHMMTLRQMLAQRQRKMMIWWHEEGYTDQAADKLAKDIVVFDWHYGNQSSYPTLQRLQEEGYTQTWATPAVTRYYDGRNDWDNTFGNISGFMAAAAARRVPGECTCTWVQGIWGGRNLFELNLYGLVFSGQCAWNSLASDYADFRWRFAREWFGVPHSLAPEVLEQQVRLALHTPYGEGKQQGYWASNRGAEELLAAPLRKTAEDLAARPALVAEATALLACCERARQNLDLLQAEATRNQVTLKYLRHDVRIMETTAKRLLLTARLMEAYARGRGLAAAESVAPLAPLLADLKALADDYRAIEAGFNDSILEAGGGRCGTGAWFPYIASGGIIFRAPQGRAELEKELAYLQQAVQAGQLPAELWVK